MAAYNFNLKAIREFTDSLEQLGPNDFCFKHTVMPHVPWRFYPDGTIYEKSKGERAKGLQADNVWSEDPHHLRIAFWRQSMQVQYADKLLGEMIASLKKSPYYDDALVIVSSDHGSNIAAQEHFRFVMKGNLRQLMAVPLLVKFPKQAAGSINERNTQSIDILPTVVDLMNIDVDWPVIGTSLRQDQPSHQKVVVSPGSLRETKYIHHLELEPETRLVQHHFLLDSSPFEARAEKGIKASKYLLRQLSEFQRTESGSIGYIRGLSAFEQVNLKSRFRPGLVNIRLESIPPGSNPLFAIALNGTIVATAKPQLENGFAFDVLLPKDKFHQGKNQLEIFQVVYDSDRKPTLKAMDLRPDPE